MSALARHTGTAVRGWLDAAFEALEEHHLVAWTRSLVIAERFGLEVARALRAMTDTQVCVLAGAVIHDLDGFCRQLDRALPAETGTHLARSIEGPGGIIERLRARGADPEAHPFKRRYYVWRDADVLLRHDPKLFGELVDAITGVAAEAEYTGEDLLLIQRAVFVGGPALDVYSEDSSGQFRRWLKDSPGRALWSVVTGVERPAVKVYAIQ